MVAIKKIEIKHTTSKPKKGRRIKKNLSIRDQEVQRQVESPNNMNFKENTGYSCTTSSQERISLKLKKQKKKHKQLIKMDKNMSKQFAEEEI